jgi:hypothetical protein
MGQFPGSPFRDPCRSTERVFYSKGVPDCCWYGLSINKSHGPGAGTHSNNLNSWTNRFKNFPL